MSSASPRKRGIVLVAVSGRGREEGRAEAAGHVGYGAMSRKAAALILGGVFPGLGQFYNREWAKGTFFLIAGIALTWLSTRALPRSLDLASAPLPRGALAALGLLLAVWLWSLVDACRRA